MNPCGAKVDIGRRGYRTICRPFRDSDETVTIVWYKALPAARVLPFPSGICNLDREPANWFSSPIGWARSGFGEQEGSPRLSSPGTPKPGALGDHQCGTAEDFRIGCHYDPTNDVKYGTLGLPVCCNPAVVGEGGVAVGGDAVVVAPPLTGASGGVMVGGESVSLAVDPVPADGGVMVGGEGLALAVDPVPADGGVMVGGEAVVLAYPPGPSPTPTCTGAPSLPESAGVTSTISTGSSQWFSFSADGTHNYIVPVTGTGASAITVHAWTGTCPGGLTPLLVTVGIGGTTWTVFAAPAGTVWLEFSTAGTGVDYGFDVHH